MYASALEITEVASIFSEDDMLIIISFGVHSQVGQALGNYAWRWVPHPITCTHLPCGNGELSSECLDLL